VGRSPAVRRALISTQNSAPPPPIEPSNPQAQPLGAYYEYILKEPQPIPDKKPEEPPQSSAHKKYAGRQDKKAAGEKLIGERQPDESAPAGEQSKEPFGEKPAKGTEPAVKSSDRK
jgi:hypothetical protein